MNRMQIAKLTPHYIYTATNHIPLKTEKNKKQFEKIEKAQDRSIEILLNRAYDGFIWLLERKRKYYSYNDIPMSEAVIDVNEWRTEIAKVIRLNEAEVQIIESLLIRSGRLQYTDESKLALINLDQAQQIFMPDNDTGKAFNNWLDMPR